MKKASCRIKVIEVLLVALLALLLSLPSPAAGQSQTGSMLAHNVYFSLKDSSEAAKTRLVTACQKYLKNHPGQVFFAAGILAGDMARDVNVRDFDVALHIIFRSRADHDKYQVAEKHKKFIAENQDNWARVRVFDSYVTNSGAR